MPTKIPSVGITLSVRGFKVCVVRSSQLSIDNGLQNVNPTPHRPHSPRRIASLSSRCKRRNREKADKLLICLESKFNQKNNYLPDSIGYRGMSSQVTEKPADKHEKGMWRSTT
jgi:hypothetical protein